jgi:hypothetical protein
VDLHHHALYNSIYSDRYQLFDAGHDISLIDCWLDLYHKGRVDGNDFLLHLGETGYLAQADIDPCDLIHGDRINSNIGWTVSMDGHGYIPYLTAVATNRGIKHVSGHTQAIKQYNFINHVVVDDQRFEADLYIITTTGIATSTTDHPWIAAHPGAHDTQVFYHCRAPSTQRRHTNCVTHNANGYWYDICIGDVSQRRLVTQQSHGLGDAMDYHCTRQPGYLRSAMVGNHIYLGKAAAYYEPLDSAMNNHANRMITHISEILSRTGDPVEIVQSINNLHRSLYEDIDRVNQYKLGLCPNNHSRHWQSVKEQAPVDLLSRLHEDFDNFRRDPATKNQRCYNASTLVNLCLHYGLPLPRGKLVPPDVNELALSWFSYAKIRNQFIGTI